MERQKTIIAPVSVSGVGLHTGIASTITFKPAPVNHGYAFCRVDLPNQPIVQADVDNVVETARGTSIAANGARVGTVEHVLAAVVGLGIDNILIEVDAPETPIMDGSSRFFVEALQEAGITEQDAARKYIEIKELISFTDREHKVEIIVLPSDTFRVATMINFGTKVLDTQFAILENISDFADQISSCRTFVFLHELESLLEKNLIKGGDLNNAIVFVDQVTTQEKLDELAKLFDKPRMEVLQEGILNNLSLQYQNEPARHKLLDIIGDLALVGRPIKGHVIARRPGHASNVAFAKKIKQYMLKEQAKVEVPVYDPNANPVYDINAIKNLLPHRPPFLLVDKIIEMSPTHVVGVKNITMNEPFFVGHFPNEPVMPGVLQIEALAQTGGILAMSQVDNPDDYLTYFLKIENVKFRRKVVPGDTLLLRLELASPIRRGLCHMVGVAYVGNKIAMEAEMVAQLSKKPELK